MGDPGPFTCSFFTPLSTADFLGKPFAWWEVKSWRILHLCWRLFSGLGCFLSFLPNWALCGPNRPLTGRGRVRSPTWGGNRLKQASWGRTGGLAWFCGTAGCEWFPQCREERKGRRIPLGGVGGICVTCWEIHRDARGESVGHFSSRVTQNADELDLHHTRYGVLFTVTRPPCTLLMGSEQERKSKQGGSQPAPSFQRHLRHWW